MGPERAGEDAKGPIENHGEGAVLADHTGETCGERQGSVQLAPKPVSNLVQAFTVLKAQRTPAQNSGKKGPSRSDPTKKVAPQLAWLELVKPDWGQGGEGLGELSPRKLFLRPFNMHA